MTIKAISTCSLDVTETVAAANSPASPADGVSNVRRYTEYSQPSRALDGTSTPVADTVVDLSRTLAGASETQDLTAAPLASDTTQTTDLTGLKMVAMLVHAPTDNNASGVTLKGGAANGYDFLGAAAYGLTIYPGMSFNILQYGAAASLPTVAAGAKNLDFGGTVGDELEILAVFGDQT